MSENIDHLLRHDSEIKDDFWDLVSQDSDRLEFQGLAFVWGCVMVLVGAIFTGPSLFRGSFDFYGWLGLFVLGTGVLAFFARSRAVLDRRAGTLEYRRVGPLSPGAMQVPLKEFSEVRLGREHIKSETNSRSATGSDGYKLITVDLITDRGQVFRLGAKRDVSTDEEVEMRQRAELLASFLHLSLRDRSSGEEVLFGPDEVQKNLAQSLGHASPEVAPPDWSAVEITEESFLLPPEGWTRLNRHLRGLAVGFCLVSGGIFSGASYGLFSGHRDPTLWAFAAISGLLFLGSFGFLKSSKDRTVKQDFLVFEEDGLAHFSRLRGELAKLGEIPYGEVVEVRREEQLRGGWPEYMAPIRVLGKTGILQFGSALNEADSDWLLHELQRRIVLRTPGR